MKIVKEFKDFLKEYKVIGLAVAFMMGVAANALVKSLVGNIIMPLVTYLIPDGTWEEATLNIGPIILNWGQFLADAIYFLVVAIVVFFIVKLVMKEGKVTKK